MSTGAAVDYDSVNAELLNNAWSANCDACLLKDPNAMLGSRVSAARAAGLWIGLPCYGEAIQIERHVRCSYIDTGNAGDRAGHIADELAVLSDGQRGGNRSTDRCRLGGSSANA